MIKAGIVGASGYAGQQLVWFLLRHPQVIIEFLVSHNSAGTAFSSLYQSYQGFIDGLCLDMAQLEDRIMDIDVLFLALPHGKSFNITDKALKLGVKVIDLGADFRLEDSENYENWYGVEHTSSHLLSKAVYGLPEINRHLIESTDLIANPGCYPTASILALAPLLKNNLIDYNSIIIDAKSGVSGAGRSANVATLFPECNESIKAYGVAGHRHTPEIEQELSKIGGKDITLTFTPHLVPMNRGILSVCYGSLTKDISSDKLYDLYREFYQGEHFVRITDTLPETRWVKGSNLCHIGLRVDKRTGRVIVISAIDNLIKGAAGQAVQNMNIMFGFKESESIDFAAMVP